LLFHPLCRTNGDCETLPATDYPSLASCRQPCAATAACLQPCVYVSRRGILCNVLFGKYMSILVLNLRATTASRDSRRYTALVQATRGREIILPLTLIIIILRRRRTCAHSRIADAAAVAAKAEPPPDRIPSCIPPSCRSLVAAIRLVVFIVDMIIVTRCCCLHPMPQAFPKPWPAVPLSRRNCRAHPVRKLES
jgi:hypothetical protein